jgi:hypothetical protein
MSGHRHRHRRGHHMNSLRHATTQGAAADSSDASKPSVSNDAAEPASASNDD